MTSKSVSDTQRVVSWAIVFTGTNVLVKGFYALTVVFLASVLSPETYANFGMLYALQGAVTTFSLTGLGETTASRLKSYPSGSRREALFRHISGLFKVTAFLTLLLLLPLMVSTLQPSISALSVVAAMLLGALIGYGMLQAGFHRIEDRHVASLLSSAGIPLGGIIGLAFGGWLFQDLTLIFSLGFAGAVAMLCFVITQGYAFVGSIPALPKISKELRILLPFLVIAVFGWLSGYGMNFVINLQFDSLYVATFTFLFTLASVGQIIVSSLNMAWAPRFYQLFNDGKLEQAESLSRFFLTLLAIALGVTGFIAVALLPWVTQFIGGNLTHYGDYQLELALLMAGYICAIPFWQGQNYYHVTGYRADFMRLMLWSGGAGLFLWVICMVILGSVGIFFGFALQLAIKAIAMWISGKRYWKLHPPWLAILLTSCLIFLGLLFPIPS